MVVQQIFAVTGLHCHSCVRAITEALGSLPEVSAVDVELVSDGPSIVQIDSDDELSIEQVQAALSEEGDYSVVV